MRMHFFYFHLWLVWLKNTFPTYLTKDTIFEKKKGCWNLKKVLDFVHSVCLKHFSYYGELNDIWSKMYIGIHVEYRY